MHTCGSGHSTKLQISFQRNATSVPTRNPVLLFTSSEKRCAVAAELSAHSMPVRPQDTPRAPSGVFGAFSDGQHPVEGGK